MFKSVCGSGVLQGRVLGSRGCGDWPRVSGVWRSGSCAGNTTVSTPMSS